MRQSHATFLGFVLAPFFSGVCLALFSAFNLQIGISQSIFLFPLAFYFSGIATLILGVPIFYVLNRLQKITWWITGIVGAFIGVVSNFTIANSIHVDIYEVIVFAVVGSISALLFWSVWQLGDGKRS